MHRNFKFKIVAKINKSIHFKEILIGSSNTIVLKVLGMILAVIATVIISRQYGAEGVGMYNLSVRTISFLAIFSTLGINVSILRFVGQFNNNGSKNKLKILIKNSFQITLPASIIIGFLLFISSEFISINIFDNNIYIYPLKIFAVLLPFMSILEICVEFIRGLKAIKLSETLRSVTRPLINICLLILLGLFIYNNVLPIMTFSIGVIISVLIAILIIIKKTKSLEDLPNSKFTKKELLNTSIPMFITSLLLFINGNVSIYFLEVYSTTDQVGIFSITLRISALISIFLVSVNTISAPKFAELYWDGKTIELQRLIFQSSKIIFIFSVISATLIIIFSKSILMFFGSEFLQGQAILKILIIGYVISATSGSVGLLMNMIGHEKTLRNFLIIIVPLIIILNFIFVPRYGIVGAAIIFAISISLMNIFTVIYCQKKLSLVTYYLPFISKALIIRKV